MNRWTFALFAGLVLPLFSASPARAGEGVAVALEVGPIFVTEDTDLLGLPDSAGVGFNGRLGYQFDGGLLKFTPEVKLGFESPGTPNAFRIMGGFRLSLFSGLQPVVFAHLGGLAGDLEGFTWDAGGGLDLALGPLLIGAAASYNRAEDQTFGFDALTDDSAAYEWVQVIASVGFVFGGD
jgi:hypothetical protein